MKATAKTKRQGGAKAGTEARGKQGRVKAITRRQIMNLCERVEELLLAMEKAAGGVLAFELSELSDQLHEAVRAG